MKRTFILCISLLIITTAGAQVPKEILNKYHRIIRLIRENKMKELSTLVSYPLKRENPLPDLANASAFIAYGSIMFDEAFRKQLSTYEDADVSQHNDDYGIGAGDLWVNSDGKLIAVNYSSPAEQKNKIELTHRIQEKAHPSIARWTSNELVARSKNLLIRVDMVDTTLRYASWSKGHGISDKPDLILYGGVFEKQGSMGGYTWTFANDDWTYIVDQADMCDDPKNCGLFLELQYKGVEKFRYRINAIK